MPIKPRFRLFGGPNGSGKTHVFTDFREKGIIHTEIYVNADRIEADLKKRKKFNFNAYRVRVDDASLKLHIFNSGLFESKIKDKSFISKFSIRAGVLRINTDVKINSYHASFVASYLADKLFQSKQSFAFETVMSHESKVELLKLASQNGYKTYFYFIFVDNISTNIARVKLRVLRGGHDVEESTIVARAPRTFRLLPSAFEAADSSYIIDNSQDAITILAKEGNTVTRSLTFPSIINKAIQDILGKLDKSFTIKTRK
jgi:predicted ABC-type ATPase